MKKLITKPQFVDENELRDKKSYQEYDKKYRYIKSEKNWNI